MGIFESVHFNFTAPLRFLMGLFIDFQIGHQHNGKQLQQREKHCQKQNHYYEKRMELMEFGISFHHFISTYLTKYFQLKTNTYNQSVLNVQIYNYLFKGSHLKI